MSAISENNFRWILARRTERVTSHHHTTCSCRDQLTKQWSLGRPGGSFSCIDSSDRTLLESPLYLGFGAATGHTSYRICAFGISERSCSEIRRRHWLHYMMKRNKNRSEHMYLSYIVNSEQHLSAQFVCRVYIISFAMLHCSLCKRKKWKHSTQSLPWTWSTCMDVELRRIADQIWFQSHEKLESRSFHQT